ncbi:MAG: hypothetical protein ABR564_06565 [Candidatus Dormibacteria bacterium]
MTKADLHRLVDTLPDEAVDAAAVFVREIAEGRIDPDQGGFLTPEWQAGEREADAEYSRGEGQIFHSDEEFIAHLETISASAE